MKHFSAWNFNKRKRLITLIVIVALVVMMVFMYPMNVLHIFNGGDKAVISKGNTSEKHVALTFNISWGDVKVHDILKVLKNNDTEATFFLSGEWAERHPQIVEKIQEDKHEIGMLGYRYKNYLDEDLDKIKEDMLHAKEVFEKMDIDTNYIRPPSGIFDKDTIELAESLDLEVVHWSVNPKDWENPGTKKLTSQVMEQSGNGDIILLHASDAAKQTAEMLNEVLPKLQEKQFKQVTISTLIKEVSVKEKLIE